MTQTKFRALRDDMSNPNWVFGNLVYGENKTPRIQQIDGKFFFTTCIPGTEGRFTDLKDSFGTDIFEGDILTIKLEDNVEPDGFYFSKSVVVMVYGCWALHEIGFDYSSKRLDEMILLHDEENEIKVIGNVIFNKELLEIK